MRVRGKAYVAPLGTDASGGLFGAPGWAELGGLVDVEIELDDDSPEARALRPSFESFSVGIAVEPPPHHPCGIEGCDGGA